MIHRLVSFLLSMTLTSVAILVTSTVTAVAATADGSEASSLGPVGQAVIAVRPAAWADAIAEWKNYREAQGHEVIELDAELGRDGIHAAIGKEVSRRSAVPASSDSSPATSTTTAPLTKRVGYVVLLADAPKGEANIAYVQPKGRKVDEAVARQPASTIPTWYRVSKAMVKFGGDAMLATDAPYADVDGDDIPDLAIGRIPADSPEAVQEMLGRTMAYERLSDFGLWRRDVRVVAGVGGFGALADSVIEMTTRRFLTDRVPQWADVCMTYASPNSPYCPDPLKFSQATVEQLNAGSMFWVYVGHGHVRHLDFLQVERKWHCILQDIQTPQVDTTARQPIAVFLACYTGAFDAQEDCLAEQLVMSPSGPVAALAATRVTGPYGLSTLASGMLEECYEKKGESLGVMLLHAKRRMLVRDEAFGESAPSNIEDKPTDSENAKPERAKSDAAKSESAKSDDVQMQMITAIASALSPAGHDLRQERLEHVWQMNLLGDPLLRVHHPRELELEPLDSVVADGELVINGTALHTGQLTMQVSRRRDHTPANLFIAKEFTNDPDIRDKMHASYEVANSRVVLECTQDVAEPGKFLCKLKVPSDMPSGRYVVRGFLSGDQSWSTGAIPLQVRRISPPAR